MKNRVRYICIPVTSLELADALPDQEKAVFIEQILRMFKSCESGSDPVPEQTESRVLDIALEDAAREIKKGYDTYVKRMQARLTSIDQSETDQRSINDQSMIAIEENRSELNENKKESSGIELFEGSAGGRPFNSLEQTQLNSALSYAGISPDRQFWSFAQKVGYRITLDAIKKAGETGSRNLSHVVKLMRESAEGVRA